MKLLDAKNDIGLCETALSDLMYLAQIIIEDFFEAFDKDLNDEDTLFLADELPRYAALYRMLYSQLFNIHKQVKDIKTRFLETK